MSGGLWQKTNQVFRNRLASWTRSPVSWDGFNMASYAPEPGSPWIRPVPVEVARSRGTHTERGMILLEGFYEFQMFFPKLTGMEDVDRDCDALAGLFRDYKSGDVWFNEPERNIVGNIEPDWYQINLAVPFVVFGSTPFGYTEELEMSVFSQASHGFSAGDVVYMSGATWTKANGGSTATAARSIIAAVNGDEFTAVNGGYVTVSNHGYTVGAILYLSTATAGLLTTLQPTAMKQQCGEVVDANTLNINFWLPTT